MAKKKRYRKGYEFPENFVMLTHELIDSPAFRSLSNRAIAALVLLIRNWQPGDKYTLPTRRTAYQFHHETKRQAILELIEMGFIQIYEKGKVWQKKPTIYKLSDRWKIISKGLLMDKAKGREVGRPGLHWPNWQPLKQAKPKKKPAAKKTKKRITTERKMEYTPKERATTRAAYFGPTHETKEKSLKT